MLVHELLRCARQPAVLERLAQHLLTPDFFDAAQFPTATFRSTSITEGGAGYLVDGDLTIGDVTRPFRLDVELGGVEEFPGGPRHAGFEARTEIRRSDFGLDLNLPAGVGSALLGDVVKVELDIQLLEPS